MNPNDKRMHWLDSGRGIAIATTMFVHLMRWVLIAFATSAKVAETKELLFRSNSISS